MKVSALNNFVCPVDKLPLAREDNTLRCSEGHSFDLAREGYCNLLLVQQKASLDPGDNKEMVAARRRFLDGRYFAPVADKLFEFVSQSNRSLRIVDAGCGEGYYLDQLRKTAVASKLPAKLELSGLDISKWAIKAAAKRSLKTLGEIAWAVAANKELPFASGSVDLILCMFGYPDWKSFKSVLSDCGRVLLVDPRPDHLIELREIIYPEVKASVIPSLKAATDIGYILKHEETMKFPVSLEDNQSIQDLLVMTPHAFRITKDAREKLRTLKNLTVSVDVVFRILQRGR